MRGTLIAACVAVATAVSPVGTGAAAADEPVIVFTAPAPGRVAETMQIELAATSTPYVRLGVQPRSSASTPTSYWLPPEPVVDGAVSRSLPTWALREFYLLAQPCSSEDSASCAGTVTATGTQQDPPTYSTANPEPKFISPSSRVLTKPSSDGPLAVRLAPGSSRVRLVLMGPKYRDLGEFETTAEHSIDFEQLAPGVNGDYFLRALWCNEVLPVCAETGGGTSPWITVKNYLRNGAHWLVAAVSPNGDGRNDLLDVELWADDRVPQTASWSLVENGVVTAGPFPLLEGSAYSETTHAEIDLRQALGRVLPSGEYALRFSFHGEYGGLTWDSERDEPLTVDTTGPGIRRFISSATTVYPVRDTYVDRVRFRSRLADTDAIAHWAEVRNTENRLIRRLEVRSGGYTMDRSSWDGRRANGRIAPEGAYKVALVARDKWGNETRKSLRINVSHKRLVARVWRRTVSASSSLIRNDSGRCSSLARSASWVTYASLSRCASRLGTDDQARGIHATMLPRAARPGTIKITLYGGNPVGFSPGFFHYLDVRERVAGGMEYWGEIDQRPSTSVTPAIEMLRPDNTIRWRLTTLNGGRFRVRDYTIVYRYRVLSR